MQRQEPPLTQDFLDQTQPPAQPPPSSFDRRNGGDVDSYISFSEDSVDKIPPESVCFTTDFLTVPIQTRKQTLVTACYISIAAVLGVLCRMIIAQIFGEECANPGTVGWLAASSPLCVTADNSATQTGGIIFADLPSNILGSFLMGVFQNGAALGLAVPMALVWLSPDHPFQSMTIIHTAFKTGFCGSLTTFSSWNSEMVVMLFGTDSTRSTQVVSALLGYIIGMETALGSFVCGKSVARRLHRWKNPTLAAEADATIERRREGVYIHGNLPDFERRYLPNLNMGDTYGEILPVGRVDALEQWRSSTVTARHVGHPMLSTLIEIEDAVLVYQRPVPPDLLSIAQSQGWQVEALAEWVQHKAREMDYLPSLGSRSLDGMTEAKESPWLRLSVASLLLVGVMTLLVCFLVALNGPKTTTVTYRTVIYACLFAPSGALLRWKLGAWWNGQFPVQGWQWLPFGTFLANIFGSLVSIAAVAIEYRHTSDTHGFWTMGTVRALKVGFGGSLTTVSTFASEVSGFMYTNTDHAYPYIVLTLMTACVLSSAMYGWIVFVAWA